MQDQPDASARAPAGSIAAAPTLSYWAPFAPKLVIALGEGYSAGRLTNDLLAGLTVAILALPLSMAIAIGAGATPDRGLVTSVDDFGVKGEKPSHPELLDWLATELPRLGWSRKAMLKLIVTSATYRQQSNLRPELVTRDPNNVLLARQNRIRLEAESVRDAYLAASGLLNPKLGGPSIRPPLPADIAALGYANSVKWTESPGAEKNRRGLYIFFQRTVPYPMLMTFDAPDSNATCTRRERSNTPLQALTLLNDPVFFECAQALGKRIAETPATNPAERLRAGFEMCLSRPPTGDELKVLRQVYDTQLKLAQASPENAAKIFDGKPDDPRVAEKATLVALSRVLLNLDEFVTRD